MRFLQLRALVAFALTLGFVSAAQATIVFAPSLEYSSRKVTDQSAGTVYGGNTEHKIMTVDARLGYVFDENGLYLGGIYKIEKDDYINGDLNGYGIGPTVGYVNGGFKFLATYYVMAERKYTIAGVERKATSGQGLQIDLGWAPEISSGFGLGPVVTYRSIKYSKTQVGTAAETSNSVEDTLLQPGILVWFTF